MNKASLIDKISEKTEVERRLVLQVLDAFEETVIERLKAGDEVTLTGFGTFIAKFRSARGGVNPQKPAERINVPAVTVPKFRAGKTFKDALKNKAV